GLRSWRASGHDGGMRSCSCDSCATRGPRLNVLPTRPRPFAMPSAHLVAEEMPRRGEEDLGEYLVLLGGQDATNGPVDIHHRPVEPCADPREALCVLEGRQDLRGDEFGVFGADRDLARSEQGGDLPGSGDDGLVERVSEGFDGLASRSVGGGLEVADLLLLLLRDRKSVV